MVKIVFIYLARSGSGSGLGRTFRLRRLCLWDWNEFLVDTFALWNETTRREREREKSENNNIHRKKKKKKKNEITALMYYVLTSNAVYIPQIRGASSEPGSSGPGSL
jgi:hypothetical protein